MCAILYLLLGWVLGIFSPVVSDVLLRGRKRREFMRAVLSELEDLQYRVVYLAWSLRTDLGVEGDDFLSWTTSIVERYDGPERDPKLLELLRRLKELTPEQRSQVYDTRRRPNRSPSVPKCFPAYLVSQLPLLSLCPEDFQQRAHALRVHFDHFNAQVDASSRWFDKTFDQTLTDENRQAVENNLNDSYNNIASKAQIIADAISELREKYQ